MSRLSLLFFLCTAPIVGQAAATPAPYKPWFSGALITTGGQNMPPGSLLLQPYYTFAVQYGRYDSDRALTALEHKRYLSHQQLFIEFGLNDWLDFNTFPGFSARWQDGERAVVFDDLYTALGFQLLIDKRGEATPNLRFLTEATFPTGKIEHGSPQKHGLDFSGAGAISWGGTLVIQKTLWPHPRHPLRVTYNIGYHTSTPAHVDGVSVYGGSPSTSGTVQPGNSLHTNLALELSLTHRWGIILENLYAHVWPSSFEGDDGGVFVGRKRQDIFSIIPEVEYNISPTQSFTAGVQWKYAGKNAQAQTLCIMSYEYSY